MQQSSTCQACWLLRATDNTQLPRHSSFTCVKCSACRTVVIHHTLAVRQSVQPDTPVSPEAGQAAHLHVCSAHQLDVLQICNHTAVRAGREPAARLLLGRVDVAAAAPAHLLVSLCSLSVGSAPHPALRQIPACTRNRDRTSNYSGPPASKLSTEFVSLLMTCCCCCWQVTGDVILPCCRLNMSRYAPSLLYVKQRTDEGVV